MTFQEAVTRSKSEYPEIIDSKAGLFEIDELDVVGIPSWNRNNPNKKRKAILEITTFKGISSNAVHFYGKIVVDGVYQATLNNIEKPKNISQENRKKYPLLDYHYEFEIKRPLTKTEITSAPQRWYAYTEGDLTSGYEDIEELINDAKEIIRLRFTGIWEFYVQYPRGNKEIMNIQLG